MNTPVVPDGMPTLSGGSHKPGEGKACVMEMVAYLYDPQVWTDTPACTYRPLAKAAQVVNDRLPSEHRRLLVPLIGRLFGSDLPIDDRAFARFAVNTALVRARSVEHLSRAKALNDATEKYIAGEITSAELWKARKDAYAAAAADAYADAYAAAYAAADAAAAAYAAAAADAYADAYAAAYAAADAAASAAAAAYAAADAAAAAAAAADAYADADARRLVASERLVAWLSSLIDEYDRLSGRTEVREVTDADVRVLASVVR